MNFSFKIPLKSVAKCRPPSSIPRTTSRLHTARALCTRPTQTATAHRTYPHHTRFRIPSSIASRYSQTAYPSDSSARSTESFPDPDRPDLFYHLFHPPPSSTPVYALSFLPHAPAFIRSRTVLGWLPAGASGGEDGAGLNDFKENSAFRTLLHEAVQSALTDDVDDVQRNGATQTQQGWMHINDERNIPALGRIGDPDDIIASVRVEEGKILAETYQPMPSYRLCTSDGILKLTDGLAVRLRERLEAEAQRELAEPSS